MPTFHRQITTKEDLFGLRSSALDCGALVRDVLERDGINAAEIGKLLLDYGLAGKEGSSDPTDPEEVAVRNAELRKKILDALERNYR